MIFDLEIRIWEGKGKVFHIICGKVGAKVRGKGWEKKGKTIIGYGEKWIDICFPPVAKVIPKVIHTVFHALYQMFFQKSTAPTNTTNTLIY